MSLESLWSLLQAAEQEREQGRIPIQDKDRTEKNNNGSAVIKSSSSSSSSCASSHDGDDGDIDHPLGSGPSRPSPLHGRGRGLEGLEYAALRGGSMLSQQQAHMVYASVPIAPPYGTNEEAKGATKRRVEEGLDERVCALEALWSAYDAWSAADVLAAHQDLSRSFDTFNNTQPTPSLDSHSSSSSSTMTGRDNHLEGYEEEPGDVAFAVDDAAATYDLSVAAAREGNATT